MAAQPIEHGSGIVSRDPHDLITPAQWDALRAAWPNGPRLTAAWRLARDIDTLAALLAGEPVPADSLNPVPLVRLEPVDPADVFVVAGEAA